MVEDFLGSLVPALLVIALIIALEDLAFMKARTKHQRAVIMGLAVFVLVFLLSLPGAAI